jgi:hypothetical protein
MSKRQKNTENIYSLQLLEENCDLVFENKNLKRVYIYYPGKERKIHQEYHLEYQTNLRLKPERRFMALISGQENQFVLKVSNYKKWHSLFFKHFHLTYQTSVKNSYFDLVDGEVAYEFNNTFIAGELITDLNGYILHREEGPAFVSYFPDGNINTEIYCKKGYVHRKGGLAEISYFPSGEGIKRMVYYYKGNIHNKDDWAEKELSNDGKIITLSYYQYGLEHNKIGPALVYKSSSFIGLGEEIMCTFKEYWIEGKRESVGDLPATLIISDEDDRECREWYRDDLLHRIGGPAVEGEVMLGGHFPNPKKEIYYIYGDEYPLFDYRRIIHNLRIFVRIWRKKKRESIKNLLNENLKFNILDINLIISNFTY